MKLFPLLPARLFVSSTSIQSFVNNFAQSLFVVVVLLACAGTARADLTVTPSTIENTYGGPIDLTITGLDSAGQTVVIEEYFDANGNGSIGAEDILVSRIEVTDGAVATIAGHRNLSVPGDEDGAANQQMHVRLVQSAANVLGKIPGRFIFRVSPVGGFGFAPFTASLIITQHDFGGSGISGQVLGGLPQIVQPGTFVVFQNGRFAEFIVQADSGGNYSMKLPPGTYQSIGAKPGFVFDTWTSPAVPVVAANFTTNQTVTLAESQRTIAGKVRDASSLAGATVALLGSAENSGFFAFAFSDAEGNYLMSATAEPWKIEAEEHSVSKLGLLFTGVVESSVGSVTGFNIDLTRVTSLIYGSVKTPSDTPVPFMDISSRTNGNPRLGGIATSNAEGDYTLGVTIGSWQVSPDENGIRGYLTRHYSGIAVNNNATALQLDLVAHPITAHLRGQVRDNHNQPVPNLPINADDLSGSDMDWLGINGNSDADGFFDFGVFGAEGDGSKTWRIAMGGDDEQHDYVSGSATFEVQDGVDQDGIVFTVYITTAHLRGQVLDENDSPIGNVFIGGWMEGNNLNSGIQVDSGGNFDLAVLGGIWDIRLSNISGLGLIPQQDFSVTVIDGEDQNGLVFRVKHGDATIGGTLKSDADVPIAGVTVFGSASNDGHVYSSQATTDAGGNYAFPVFSGTWSVGVDSGALIAQGYQPVDNQEAFVPSGTVTVNFVASSACIFADLDCSGQVDNGDVGLVLLDFGPCEGCPTDLDGSGEVDNGDVGLVLLNFS